MAKYTKRKDGRYCTTVTIGRTAQGKRKLKSFYGNTIKELEAKLAEFKSLQNKGIIISDNKITLAEWSKKWLDTYKQGVAYNTFEMYRNCVETHIITADIANLPLNKIKTVDLQTLINHKQAEGLTRTPGIIVLTLRQIFKQAIENDLLYKNPAIGIVKPSHKIKPKRTLSPLENKAIEKADLTDRERAFIYLGKYAGLRRGEILALSKSDFNLNEKTIKINKTVVFKVNEGNINNMPKSVAGFRTIPMPDILYGFIKGYLKTVDIYLFSTQKAKICSKSSFNKMWSSILKKLNLAAGGTSNIKPISGLTPHILRHDYATSLYRARIDIKTAQKLLGHSDIKMTLQIYTHLEQDNKDIKNKLNNLFYDKNNPSDSQMIVKA